jgi:hypothetical protein
LTSLHRDQSPSRNVCQVFHLTRYAVLQIIGLTRNRSSFDAIKNSCC